MPEAVSPASADSSPVPATNGTSPCGAMVTPPTGAAEVAPGFHGLAVLPVGRGNSAGTACAGSVSQGAQPVVAPAENLVLGEPGAEAAPARPERCCSRKAGDWDRGGSLVGRAVAHPTFVVPAPA